MLPIPDSAEPAVWRFWAELMPFVAVLFCTLAGWIGERRQIKIVGRITGGALAAGTVVGLFWIGLVISILVLGGFMTVGRECQTVPLLGLWLVALLLNTVMQELLVRGYLYRLIQRHYNTVAAALVTTLLFLLCHGSALEAGWLPCANIVLMSFFVTAVLEATDSLVVPILIHFIWNRVGGVLYGGVSLAEDYPHLYDITMHGNDLISGGVFKIEGSAVVLMVNALFFVAFAWLAWRKSKPH